MKILLFGGSGQLGFEILKRAHDLNFEIVSPVAAELDISEGEQVVRLAEQTKPTLIIKCAAYTAVDRAEQEPQAAFRINADGAQHAARAAASINARLVHISTDYVFDGEASVPYSEDAATNPLNVYGKSKLAGERAVLELLPKSSIVLRTSSLHGQKGINFVHTMLRLFSEGKAVKVVNDQIMCTTWAGWLAEVILDLARLEYSGVLHACCDGALSWYDFATQILELIQKTVEPAKSASVSPQQSSDLDRAAKRPMYSVLNCNRLSELIGRKPIGWQAGLKEHLRDLGYAV